MHDVEWSIGENADGLFTEHKQEISERHLDFLKQKRNDFANDPCGDFLHVASIPAVFVVKWMNEGLNVYTAPLKDIVRKIKQEGCEAFLATEKTV